MARISLGTAAAPRHATFLAYGPIFISTAANSKAAPISRCSGISTEGKNNGGLARVEGFHFLV